MVQGYRETAARATTDPGAGPVLRSTHADPSHRVERRPRAPPGRNGVTHPRSWVLLLAALLLFAVWSNSFIAIAFLLGRDGAVTQFDWFGLMVAWVVASA